MISPLAYIHPEAKIGENVEIAPFVYIDRNVVIGDNNKIMAECQHPVRFTYRKRKYNLPGSRYRSNSPGFEIQG